MPFSLPCTPMSPALSGQYQEASKHIKKAVELDEQKDLSSALHHYLIATEKYLIVSKWGPEAMAKVIRPKMAGCISRAEEIKKIISATQNTCGDKQVNIGDDGLTTASAASTEQALRLALAESEEKVAMLNMKVGNLTSKLEAFASAMRKELERRQQGVQDGPRASGVPSPVNEAKRIVSGRGDCAKTSSLARPAEHFCAVSSKVLCDPVLSTCPCGATIERSVIKQWWTSGNSTCPVCCSTLTSAHLLPNVALKKIIQNWDGH